MKEVYQVDFLWNVSSAPAGECIKYSSEGSVANNLYHVLSLRSVTKKYSSQIVYSSNKEFCKKSVSGRKCAATVARSLHYLANSSRKFVQWRKIWKFLELKNRDMGEEIWTGEKNQKISGKITMWERKFAQWRKSREFLELKKAIWERMFAK